MYRGIHRISVMDAVSLYCHATYNKNHKCYVTDPSQSRHVRIPIFSSPFLCLYGQDKQIIKVYVCMLLEKAFSRSPNGRVELVPVTGCWCSQCHGVRSIGSHVELCGAPMLCQSHSHHR